MLPKRNRNSKKDVARAFKFGRVVQGRDIYLRYIYEDNNNPPRFSFIIPKETAKKSTERNSLRRLGYQAIGPHFHKLPQGLRGVLVLKKRPGSEAALLDDIEDILHKIN